MSQSLHFLEKITHLRMTNVGNLFRAGVVDHGLDTCRKIVLSHFVPRKLPKFFIIRIQPNVLPGVGVPTTVSHPNIIACVSENKAQTLVSCVDHPRERGIQQTMLQEDHFLTS